MDWTNPKRKMEMIRVKSSDLDSVGYDEKNKMLAIKFHNGTYEYFGVPKEVFLGLLDASSKGKYFQEFIKYAYRYKKIG